LDIEERKAFFVRCSNDSTLESQLSPLFELFSARYGDGLAFSALVERLKSDPLDVAETTISLFGHHQNREMAVKAAELVRDRVKTAEEAVGFAHSAVSGMLYVYEMDLLFSGALDDALPHPGIDAWQTLLLEWSTAIPMSEVQQMSVLTNGGCK